MCEWVRGCNAISGDSRGAVCFLFSASWEHVPCRYSISLNLSWSSKFSLPCLIIPHRSTFSLCYYLLHRSKLLLSHRELDSLDLPRDTDWTLCLCICWAERLGSVVYTQGWSPTPRASPWGSERSELWCKSLWCRARLPHVCTRLLVSSEPDNTDTFIIQDFATVINWLLYSFIHLKQKISSVSWLHLLQGSNLLAFPHFISLEIDYFGSFERWSDKFSNLKTSLWALTKICHYFWE